MTSNAKWNRGSYMMKHDIVIETPGWPHNNIPCSTMRGRIKGTDSTINAILATAVLYELRWKIWNGAE